MTEHCAIIACPGEKYLYNAISLAYACLLGSEKRGQSMEHEVKRVDSVFRTSLGIIIALAGIFAPISIGMRIVAFVAAVVYFFTGIFGY